MQSRCHSGCSVWLKFFIIIFLVLLFLIPAEVLAAERNLNDVEKDLIKKALEFLAENGVDSIDGFDPVAELEGMLDKDAPDGMKELRRETDWTEGNAAASSKRIRIGLPNESDINTDINTAEGFTQVKTVAQTLYHEWVHWRQFKSYGSSFLPAIMRNWQSCQPNWAEIEAYYREIKIKLDWKLTRESSLMEINSYIDWLNVQIDILEDILADDPENEELILEYMLLLNELLWAENEAYRLEREIADLEEQIDDLAGKNNRFLGAERNVNGKRKTYEGIESGKESECKPIYNDFKNMDSNDKKLDEVIARLDDVSRLMPGKVQSIAAKIQNKVLMYDLMKLLEFFRKAINLQSGGWIKLELPENFIDLQIAPQGMFFPEGDIETELSITLIDREYMEPWEEAGWRVLSPVYQIEAIDEEAVMANPDVPALLTLSYNIETVNPGETLNIYRLCTELGGHSENGSVNPWEPLPEGIISWADRTITVPCEDPFSLFVVMIPFPYGDVNLTGNVNVADAIMVLRHIVGLVDLHYQFDSGSFYRADVNGDDNIDIDDVVIILQYIIGLIDSFPVAQD